MNTNKEIQDDTQSRQSCVSVSVTDLRIGNLLHYNNKLKSVGKVTLLVADMIDDLSYCQFNHRKDKKHWLFNLEPILLNEEWLIKLGFTKNEFDSHYERGEFYVEIWENDCVFRWNDFNVDINLKYVHKLQNLYFILTGSELKNGYLTEH